MYVPCLVIRGNAYIVKA